MFKQLRNRLLLLNMVLISLVMVAAFCSIYFITYSNVRSENQRRLATLVRQINMSPGNFELRHPQFNLPNTRVIIPRGRFEFSPSFTAWVNGEGEVMNVITFMDMPGEVYEQLVKETWRKNSTEGIISLENHKWQYVISPLQSRQLVSTNGEFMLIVGNVLYQVTFLDITESSRTLTHLLLTFVIVGLVMLIILFGVSYHFANRSIRPIEENWVKQKQFVADASHELKTPLAIINANSDALLANSQETVDSQRKWIHYIQAQTGRMSKLINDMLYLAQVEDAPDIHLPFHLSHVVSDVVASLEAVLFEKGITLTQEVEADIIVRGDADKIKQAVLILLDNALKYTNEQGYINITLKKAKNKAIFAVQNTGEKIPEDQLPRVFDRFYRVDPSRSKETGGYGLGLSIAKTIIMRSGGSITAASTEEFTTFTFELKTT